MRCCGIRKLPGNEVNVQWALWLLKTSTVSLPITDLAMRSQQQFNCIASKHLFTAKRHRKERPCWELQQCISTDSSCLLESQKYSFEILRKKKSIRALTGPHQNVDAEHVLAFAEHVIQDEMTLFLFSAALWYLCQELCANAGHLVSQLRLWVKRDFGICEEFPYVSLLLWGPFHWSTKPAARIKRRVSVPV